MRIHRLLLIALLLAAILRVWGLADESLWLDEGFTYRRVCAPLPSLIGDLKVQTQGIAYYLIERGWCRVFGTSEFSLRFPSVIFGTLSVLALYLFGARFFSKITAGIAALILAINPFAVFYSQDARPYALFLLAALASLHAFLRLLEKWTTGRIAAYLFFTLLALYAHPYAPFLLVAESIGWLILRRDAADARARRIGSWLGLLAIMAVLFLPQLWLVSNSIGKKFAGTGPGAWIPMPWIANLFGTFKTYFMTAYLAVVAALVIFTGLWLGLRREAVARRRIVFLVVVGLSFTALPWLLSRLVTPIYYDRYTIPAAAMVALLMAWSLAQFPRWGKIVTAVVLALLTTHALFLYHTGLDKDPWRETANEVERRSRTGDLVFLVKHFSSDAFGYYFAPPPGVRLIAPHSTEGVFSVFDEADRIILVKSYMYEPMAFEDSLLDYITHGRRNAGTVRIADGVRRNPWLPSIHDITVTVFEPDSTNFRN
ncbi:MAG: glycosyltransferase family 39 protein [bacterium]|nr:glycosyltransferase family 39 protein [bacterium]